MYQKKICIACITIDSVMRMEKEDYPQVYLDECKYKIRKIQMTRFINTELDLDSGLDLESDDKLVTKSKSDSDNDLYINLLTSFFYFCFS